MIYYNKKYNQLYTNKLKIDIILLSVSIQVKLDLARINWVFPGSNFIGPCIKKILNLIFLSSTRTCI